MVVVLFGFGGANALFKLLHVSFLSFIRFRNVFVALVVLNPGKGVRLPWQIAESKVVLAGKPSTAWRK